jgi:hypothetical protein
MCVGTTNKVQNAVARRGAQKDEASELQSVIAMNLEAFA